jgi:hypothetical protein
MIRPRYALQLARTKLRSKKGVLIASVMVSSILFGALITAIIVFTGVQKSAVRFVEAANNNHYLVAVKPSIPHNVSGFYDDNSGAISLDTVRAIKAFQKQYYIDERAKYKAAGVEYDTSLEVSALKPMSYVDKSISEEQRVMIDWASPVTNAMLEQKFIEYAKTAQNKFSDIQRIGAQYGATDYYSQSYTLLPSLPALRLVQNGKEDFAAESVNEPQILTADKNAIHNGAYSFSDDALLGRNLLTTDTKNLKGIPVVPTAQEVASLFGKEIGVSTEPKAESQKLPWLKSVQEKAKGFVYQACYRNTAEQALLDKIQNDYVEMKANEGNKDYQKPSLIYNYPENACGDITIQSDTRTAAEKQIAAKAEADQKKLGTYVAPAHRLLTFQVVGLTYAQAFVYSPTNATDFVKGLLSGNNYNSPASSTVSIPTQMYETLPASMRFDDLTQSAQGPYIALKSDDFKDRIVAFNTIDEAHRFVSDVGCPSSSTNCSKLFYTDPYGSNYLLLDEIGKVFLSVMSVAFPILLGLALVIIWFTVSRIMAENRKETAVYRAMGAKRSDITAIYTTYIILVAFRIALLSLILGIVAAYVINMLYAPGITATASSMFGIIDNAPHFSMFDLSSPLLWLTVGLIFVVSLVASIQPLIRNVLRPPVQDMRSE